MRARTLQILLLALIASSNAFAEVKPGDVVTAANAAQVRGLVPEEIAPYDRELPEQGDEDRGDRGVPGSPQVRRGDR